MELPLLVLRSSQQEINEKRVWLYNLVELQ